MHEAVANMACQSESGRKMALTRFAGANVEVQGSCWVGVTLKAPQNAFSQLGSCAELMVEAMFARNKTRNATRITTTPPTVIRSQKSELSRISFSSLADVTTAHIHNSTVGADVCSDPHHIHFARRVSASGYQNTL
jgi:hypothetical protein